MNHRFRRLAALLCACLALTGCMGPSALPAAQLTLPPAQRRYTASNGSTL